MVKIGDKVICINSHGVKDSVKHEYAGVILPKVGKRYTICGFHHYSDSDYISVTLEEIENDYNPDSTPTEIHFPVMWFELENAISIERELIEKEVILN